MAQRLRKWSRSVLWTGAAMAAAVVAAAPVAAGAQADARRSQLEVWFPRLRPGMWVKVEGQPGRERGLHADKLKALGGDLDESEVTSTIVAIDVERGTLDTQLGVRVVATLRTVIQGRRKHDTFATLRVGDRIETEGQVQKDGTLLADEIEIKGNGEDEDEITGRIESIDAATHQIRLLGIPVQLDAGTRNKSPIFD